MAHKIDNFALIIGSMKSGTTSLFNYLAEHPEIGACKHKEPHFFSKGDRFKKGFDYYQSLWAWDDRQHKIALEASAGYTGIKSVDMSDSNQLNSAASIARFQAEHKLKFKFIYIMRDPVERLESHFNHIQAWKYHQQEISAEKFELMIDSSKYAMQLDEYYQRFPTADFLLLDFTELKQNPQKLVKKVFQFLDVDPNYQCQSLGVQFNPHQRKRRIKIPGWYAVRKSSVMQSIVMSTPPRARDVFQSWFGKKVNHKYVNFSPAEKQYVLSKLQPDMQKLRWEYQFDTSNWNLDKQAVK